MLEKSSNVKHYKISSSATRASFPKGQSVSVKMYANMPAQANSWWSWCTVDWAIIAFFRLIIFNLLNQHKAHSILHPKMSSWGLVFKHCYVDLVIFLFAATHWIFFPLLLFFLCANNTLSHFIHRWLNSLSSFTQWCHSANPHTNAPTLTSSPRTLACTDWYRDLSQPYDVHAPATQCEEE